MHTIACFQYIIYNVHHHLWYKCSFIDPFIDLFSVYPASYASIYPFILHGNTYVAIFSSQCTDTSGLLSCWICVTSETHPIVNPKMTNPRLPITYFSMVTSSNGNIFRVTGPLWEESTGHRWIPLTKASDAELRWFLWSAPEQTVEQTETPLIWDAIALVLTPLSPICDDILNWAQQYVVYGEFWRDTPGTFPGMDLANERRYYNVTL